ncbi:uncharacterized protein LOC141598621 isoform X2 [Silene latifolia]|uniref:uncharacterized protein LOC141598621 isoform X2 n=1 Tax=Silene latifolia TaxID=37657 RepID=UPI003D7889C1
MNSIGNIPFSDSKVKVGSKRDGEELEDDSDFSRKFVRMTDLQSEGIATHDPETSKTEESEEHMDIIETQSSQIVDKNADERVSAGLTEGPPKKLSNLCGSKPLDLNTDLCTDENSGYNDVIPLGDSRKQALYEKGKTVKEFGYNSLCGSNLNLNVEDVTSSANHDIFTHRPRNNLKTRDTLSLGRNTTSLEEKDGLRRWKEMKQNGFMSSPFGGIPQPPPPPVAPKRGRKSKNDVLKQKMEQAKKEQVDRFAKIAAPSGLLNGLNPGIINHVRNSKQVHSIIQALVRSEKQESLKQASEMKLSSQEIPEKRGGLENISSSFSHGVGSLVPESMKLHENRLLHSGSSPFKSRDIGGQGESANDRRVAESTSCLSNDESASVDTLSVKAATVASQWLQLLQQDIKDRLSALRRSKKRVNAVITTELPSLLSKEFESNQDIDPSIAKDHVTACSNKASAELHQAKWSNLFNQMDASLSEEEKQLECWLNEVSQMLQLCDKGLQHVQLNMAFEMQRLGAFSNDFRSKTTDPEKELPVRAAAASIYSTANYASRENVSCC